MDMAQKTIEHKEPIMGLFDRRIGKLIRPTQVGDPWWAFCYTEHTTKDDQTCFPSKI